MSEQPELKPCPFCGSDAILIETMGIHRRGFRAECAGCEAQIGTDDYGFIERAIAVAHWNNRADDWRPIETAPRDVGALIVYCSLGPYIATWNSRISEWIDGKGVIPNCTHWMPLPEPPALTCSADMTECIECGAFVPRTDCQHLCSKCRGLPPPEEYPQCRPVRTADQFVTPAGQPVHLFHGGHSDADACMICGKGHDEPTGSM